MMRPPKRLQGDVVLATLCQMQRSWFGVYDMEQELGAMMIGATGPKQIMISRDVNLSQGRPEARGELGLVGSRIRQDILRVLLAW